jgi:hypothetical protein
MALITALPPVGTLAPTDLIYVGKDPGGTPSDAKATVAEVLALLPPGGGGGGAGYPPVTLTPLDQSTWTWVNQGAAAVTQFGGLVRFECPNAGTENVRARVMTLPGGTPTVTAALAPFFFVLGGGADYMAQGLCLRESGTGKIVSFMLQMGPAATWDFAYRKNTNPTTFSAGANLLRRLGQVPSLVFLRLTILATTYEFHVSFDGVNWLLAFSESKTAFLLGGADQVGIMAFNISSTAQSGYASWASWAVT